MSDGDDQVSFDAKLLRVDDFVAGKEQFTDLTNGEQFVKEFREKIRFCTAWNKWLIWDGNTWHPDDCNEIYALVKSFIRGMYLKTGPLCDAERSVLLRSHLIKSESIRKRQALIESASHEQAVRLFPHEVDSDPFVFNVQNGTIDLRTGILHEPMKEKFITKCAKVVHDRNAQSPEWNMFLLRIMDGNGRLITFLQKAVGWALTGDMSEQVMFILYGSGANGKSTFLNAIMEILGDYAMSSPTETFMKKHGEGISNDIARLRGTRFVTTVEAEEGKRMSEPLIKQVTGQDMMTARFLYGEYFDFAPSFKIFMATNHKPVIRGNDHGIWRRIRLVPFTVTIPYEERDPNLMEKLRKEAPGILNWMVEGCLLWQKERLGEPEEVKLATEEYQEDMDLIGSFIRECCIVDPSGYLRIGSGELYRAYTLWCEKNSERPYAQRIFGIHLQNMGVGKERDSTTRYWKGIAIRTES